MSPNKLQTLRESLYFPRRITELAEKLGCSHSSVRRALSSFGSDLQVGYTRPRTYWLTSEEQAYEKRVGFRETQTLSSRNRMG